MNVSETKKEVINIDSISADKIEVLLLLKCCQQFVFKNALEEINAIIQNNSIDWGVFTKLAKTQSVRVPVFHVIIFNQIKNVPPNVIIRMKKVQAFTLQRNKNMARELIRAGKVFRKHGLNAIPYKGMVFASQFYNNIIQRTSVDIDFALEIDQFRNAAKAMEELGYEEIKGSLHEDAIEKSRAFYLDYPWVLKKDGKVIFNLEFHWTPSHHILNIPIQFHEFMDKLDDVNIGNQTVQTFDRVHQALFAVIHHGNVDCWGKLKHVLDFGLILKTLNATELKELEDLCKQYKIYKSYEIGKSFLAELLDYKIESTSKPSKRWKNELLTGKLKGNWSENKYKFLFFINSRDSFIQKIKAAYSIIKYQFFIKPKLEG